MKEFFLVVSGELIDVNAPEPTFRATPTVVGLYPFRERAYDAWKATSWSSVDNAHARCLIISLMI